MFTAATLADSLFCWRLYVIWPRSIRIILFPVVLLAIHTLICIAIVVLDLLISLRPHRTQYFNSNRWLNIAELATVLLYTLYNTILIAGRIAWIGHQSNKLASRKEAKGNRYRGAIAALVQSGVVYLVTILLFLGALATMNIVMISVANKIAMIINGISVTLLVLQLNLFQERTLKREIDGPPLTTGATFKFARVGMPPVTPGEWSSTQSSVVTRRRASMSMVES
ncbi:hypothetical protein FRB94_014156 [Tulasnella sp. JGI-2019a]|nr:hypothetical protein FRB94_014156 [Tulasnella sp. JGI-2019a]